MANDHGTIIRDMSIRTDGTEDWILTISRLMNLAQDATESFDFERAIEYLNTAEQIWDSKTVPELSITLRQKLHKEKGRVFSLKGNLDKAIEEYQKVLKLCRDTNHLAVKSDTFTQIGQLLGKQGDYDRALGFHQRAIGACRRIGDNEGLCRALRNLGVIYVELGEFEEAVTTYDEAVALASTLQGEMLYADLVNNLGTIMNMRGDWKRALDLYRESLGIYRSNCEVRKSAYTMNNLAITYGEQGYPDDAFHYFKQALKTAAEIKDYSLTLIVNINLADLYLKDNQLSSAKDHCEKALKYLEMSDLKNSNYVEICKIRAQISVREQQYNSAMHWFNVALELAKKIGTQFQEAEVLFERGNLNGLMENHFDALSDLESSYMIFTNVKADGKKNEASDAIESIESLYLKIFEAMAQKVDEKDKYTKGHSDRVASLSLLIAKEFGLSTSLQKTIVAGALLHDIGKIKIDDSILKKEGKLSNEEYLEIQKHPELGVEVLKGKEFPWDIKPLILHHHEKIDGTGYPAGLKGEEIPFNARIICVADVFDALTSDRVYRKAFTVEKALKIMLEDSGSAFDPIILNRFEELIRTGKADCLINSDTADDRMYQIWKSCLDSKPIEESEPKHCLVTT